jgi:diguanylate cyclase (GGDEF)-like protein/PAS domain S-box-containing protein
VSRSAPELPSLPLQLTALQVIGLQDPPGCGWARLRCLQYVNLKRFALVRIVTQVMAAVVVAQVLLGKAPLEAICLWAIALILAIANAYRVNRNLSDLDWRSITRFELVHQVTGVVLTALAWSAAMVLAHLYVGFEDQMMVWAIMLMLIAGSAATMASAPLPTVVFATITCATAMTSFSLQGHAYFGVLTAVFLITLIHGVVESGRMFLTARIAEAGATEKDQVVSLLLREFEENEADWLWQIDTHRRIVAPSSRFAYALGQDAKSLIGQSFIKMISGSAWESGAFPPSLHDLAERLKKEESFSNLLVQVELGGSRHWWEISGTPIADEEGKFVGYRGVGSDVTERRESDEKIAYLARYDTLTGLPNRLMLIEAMGEGLRYAEQWRTRCAFLMVDLDRFKAVNDSLGHQIGDQLLSEVSERLKAVAGDNCVIGRLGGDEFAVVVRDASDPACARQIAETVIDRLSQPYVVKNHTLYIGASVGSALGPRDGDTVETLMRNADLALYRAKGEGGGVHCSYEPSLHANAEERHRLELSLRRAVGAQEMSLNFQPVVNAFTEDVVSFEALLRWNSKEHGPVSPGKFIPLAEDTRLIVPIGQWVLHEACRQAVRWPDHIKVAVNVSGEQLLEPGFSASVVRALADTGLPAHRLEVEVTESIFLRDGRTARQTLEEIMALGCGVALDDFGTGYSSLGYLRNLRFSTIKVDRSFVQGAAQGNAESLAIIRAVVAMAQSLEMETTAEGAETAEEVALIRQLGCTKIQGYYFGRPMEPADAHALVDRKRRGQAVA